MKFKGIESALRDGSRLRAYHFGSLQVIRVEKGETLIGYGEHLHVDGALAHTDHYILVSGRTAHMAPGFDVPDFVTDRQSPNGYLDYWLSRGQGMEAWFENNLFHVRLKGFGKVLMRDIDKLGRGTTFSEALAAGTKAECGFATQ